ncbi:hypothetical protein LTR53_015920 [Teratosphaeriaceae sp. CCFEE 6253]|nr:hypothetical protein LTR53_015920 [Teratosphaeriaceae sp. CCFEE 6253]
MTRIEMTPQSHHPDIVTPPLCLCCGQATVYAIAQADNPNGNAGRPYYACDHPGGFLCFADMRGIHVDNPTCDCPARSSDSIQREGFLLSRMQVAGTDGRQTIARSVHFTCAVGGCEFYRYMQDDQDGHVVTLPNMRLDAAHMIAIGL